jgi:hypothetical protein
METKNYGLIIEPFAPEDFLGGTSQSLEARYGAEILNPEGDWSKHTPSTENQDTSTGDTFACVSFGTTNAIEMLARLRFEQNANLSDRFLAKLSDTVVGQGNSPKKVADTLRHKWSVSEPEWPDVERVEDYYAEIPERLKTLAVGRGAEFEFGYQYITNSAASIKEALKRSPVCIAVTAWLYQTNTDTYIRVPGIQENHWTTVIKVLPNGNYLCFDSFAPFLKEVHPSACQSVAMSYYLNRQVVKESAWQKFIKAILSWFKDEPMEPPQRPQDAPKPVETTPPTPFATPRKLDAFCKAIQTHEGFFAPGENKQHPNGTLSWRNNNPGNIKYGPFAKSCGATGSNSSFAVFPSYEVGFEALKTLVRNAATGKSSIYRPDMTVAQFFAVYAPSADNNDPQSYAAAVGKRIGEDYKTFIISNLV